MGSMVEDEPKEGMAGGFWASPRLSWTLVLTGLGLFMLSRAPAIPEQIAQCSQGMNARNLLVLGYLFAISVLPIVGLWRLSDSLRLPRALSFLYLLFPLAIVGVYVVWPLINRVRTNR